VTVKATLAVAADARMPNISARKPIATANAMLFVVLIILSFSPANLYSLILPRIQWIGEGRCKSSVCPKLEQPRLPPSLDSTGAKRDNSAQSYD